MKVDADELLKPIARNGKRIKICLLTWSENYSPKVKILCFVRLQFRFGYTKRF